MIRMIIFEIWLSYTKLHKSWTESLWQIIQRQLKRNEGRVKNGTVLYVNDTSVSWETKVLCDLHSCWTFTYSLNLILALTIWVCCSVGSYSRICWIHHSRIVQSCQGSHLRSRASLLCGQWSVHWALRCQNWWRSLCFCQLRWISWCLASAHSSWSKTSGWKIWNKTAASKPQCSLPQLKTAE